MRIEEKDRVFCLYLVTRKGNDELGVKCIRKPGKWIGGVLSSELAARALPGRSLP